MTPSPPDPSTSPRNQPHADRLSIPLNLTAVQVVDVVSRVVHALDEAGSRVHLVMERTPTVIAEAEMLAEVTSNLLQSALRHAPQNVHVEVSVAARCLAAERAPEGERPSHVSGAKCAPAVSVAISDSNSEMSEGEFSQIILSREALASTHRDSGHRMSAQDVLQLHKGSLWFHSEPAEGRTFGFCLNSSELAA